MLICCTFEKNAFLYEKIKYMNNCTCRFSFLPLILLFLTLSCSRPLEDNVPAVKPIEVEVPYYDANGYHGQYEVTEDDLGVLLERRFSDRRAFI